MTDRVAYIVNVKGWQMFAVVSAKTAGVAKSITLRSMRDAGYEKAKFTDISARRDKTLDVWAKWEKRHHLCYTMEYIEHANVMAHTALTTHTNAETTSCGIKLGDGYCVRERHHDGHCSLADWQRPTPTNAENDQS